MGIQSSVNSLLGTAALGKKLSDASNPLQPYMNQVYKRELPKNPQKAAQANTESKQIQEAQKQQAEEKQKWMDYVKQNYGNMKGLSPDAQRFVIKNSPDLQEALTKYAELDKGGTK